MSSSWTGFLPQRSLACLAVLVTAMAGVMAAGAARAPRIFGGKVLEAPAGQRWFVMQAGASKKQPRAKILVTSRTRWTGLARPSKRVLVGDSVVVTVSGGQNGSWTATTVLIKDSKQGPAAGSATSGRP